MLLKAAFRNEVSRRFLYNSACRPKFRESKSIGTKQTNCVQECALQQTEIALLHPQGLDHFMYECFCDAFRDPPCSGHHMQGDTS